MITFIRSETNDKIDSVRQAVFLDEQKFSQEFDEYEDRHFVYISAYHQGLIVGVVRVKLEDEKGILGRLAVLKEYRKIGLGAQLVNQAEELLKEMGAKEVHLHAQEQAIGFYERCGYVAYGDFEMDEYMPHKWMMKEIEYNE